MEQRGAGSGVMSPVFIVAAIHQIQREAGLEQSTAKSNALIALHAVSLLSVDRASVDGNLMHTKLSIQFPRDAKSTIGEVGYSSGVARQCELPSDC